MSTISNFDWDDVKRNIEKTQNELAKRERKIEVVDPILIGVCVRCGDPLVDRDNPLRMCSKCLRDTGHDVYEMDKKKRKVQAKGKKMSGRHVLHIDQIKVLG